MKRDKIDYVITAVGAVVLAVGLLLVKTDADAHGFMQSLPYLCIGIGCGVFGHGMGNVIARRAVKNHPYMQKKMEIEQKDERNLAIANRAKAKAYDLMTGVFGALLVAFAFMNIDLTALLLLVFAYLLVHGYGIYYQCKYEKEM
ncbi:MAG: DUF6442 family protein [Oscillospiraceae bacterium]|nr:DUF6442 family protein [Oscillospiraceae bacterium]